MPDKASARHSFYLLSAGAVYFIFCNCHLPLQLRFTLNHPFQRIIIFSTCPRPHCHACFRPKLCLLWPQTMLALMPNITEDFVKGRIKIRRKDTNVFAEAR